MSGGRDVVVFGEVMMRLAAPPFRRLSQATSFEVAYTGAEANAAVSLQRLGGVSTWLVSRVPDTELGQACVDQFRRFGVNTDAVLRGGSRLGTFYLETGADQRPSTVIYDRAGSAVTELRPGDIPWTDILKGKRWLHLSGSAPALSESLAAVTLEACRAARAAGVTVSIDLNFRRKLWQWDPTRAPRELARAVMPGILSFADVLTGNEEDAFDVFGIRAGDSDVAAGRLSPDGYRRAAAEIAARLPQLKRVAFTLRESLSASRNRWGGMLFDTAEGACAFAPLDGDGNYQPYDITHIVDRVGGGDSFSAGLIHAELHGLPLREAAAFAVAASCLKHSIPGDFNLATAREVRALMAGDASGRVQR
jgi:2-dehydro-3-deoxygluconokinase